MERASTTKISIQTEFLFLTKIMHNKNSVIIISNGGFRAESVRESSAVISAKERSQISIERGKAPFNASILWILAEAGLKLAREVNRIIDELTLGKQR